MAYGITDFTRTNYKYQSDDGNEYTIKARTALGTSTGLTAGAGANGPRPTGCKPRHVWCSILDGTKLIRRKYPCSPAFADTVVLHSTTINIDGEALVVTGYVGEKIRG